MWTRAARNLSAEMLTPLSRSIAAILLFPVISGTILSPTPTTRNCWPRPQLRPRPTWVHRLTRMDSHTRTHPHRLALTAGSHIHTHLHSHTQTHTHAVLHSHFHSLEHPRWSRQLAGDTSTSLPDLSRSQSRSGARNICLRPNRAHRLCYKMLQQRSPSFLAPATGAPVRI